MNARRAGYRDKWVDAVLAANQLTPTAKLVCIALSRRMSDEGRVRVPRAEIAAAVGLNTVQRVTDRIKEAKDANFLSHIGGGINGTVAMYDAMIPSPGTPIRGTSSSGRGNGKRGTRNGVPEAASEMGSGTPIRGAIRARASKTNRECEPAPIGSRVEREHDETSQAGNYGSWQPTPVADASCDSTEDVA